ncbi:hypothetical protein BDR22DRAFT_685040 [Usnea florida]
MSISTTCGTVLVVRMLHSSLGPLRFQVSRRIIERPETCYHLNSYFWVAVTESYHPEKMIIITISRIRTGFMWVYPSRVMQLDREMVNCHVLISVSFQVSHSLTLFLFLSIISPLSVTFHNFLPATSDPAPFVVLLSIFAARIAFHLLFHFHSLPSLRRWYSHAPFISHTRSFLPLKRTCPSRQSQYITSARPVPVAMAPLTFITTLASLLALSTSVSAQSGTGTGTGLPIASLTLGAPYPLSNTTTPYGPTGTGTGISIATLSVPAIKPVSVPAGPIQSGTSCPAPSTVTTTTQVIVTVTETVAAPTTQPSASYPIPGTTGLPIGTGTGSGYAVATGYAKRMEMRGLKQERKRGARFW